MPEEPLYDPDRSVVDDLDFTDPEVALAYLDNPVTEKLHDDLNRLFRSMPASYQQEKLSGYISELEERRAKLAAHLGNLDHDAPARPMVEHLLDAVDKNIEGAKLRMLELD
ncbi:hypothetical protein A5725_05375 [Mycobacterium kubicae]|uniref:hypothetical protein n=1 Tax=Mycobacterium kubicae TaxID=120959 RepID=UPI0007FE97A8|nr:hypothetical protein [Mycobacterium kubicae]OBF15096.1 hypothetical protein A5725_05375 [Mycobacterium kubicae]